MDFARRILVPVTLIATLGFSSAAFASSRAGSAASDGTGQSSAIAKNKHSVTDAVADRPSSARASHSASTTTRTKATSYTRSSRSSTRSAVSAASSRGARAR
jgi:hypothetical protein